MFSNDRLMNALIALIVPPLARYTPDFAGFSGFVVCPRDHLCGAATDFV